MKLVAIGGSRALPPGHAARWLIRFLGALKPDWDARVLLRRGISTEPGHFEKQVEDLCVLMGIPYEYRIPEPGGRAAVYDRDILMVQDAELVLAFLTLEQVGDELSGTFGLVDKALWEHTPVYAYALGPDNRLFLVGEHDPKNLWSEYVPAGD